jgi:hypothetical protein
VRRSAAIAQPLDARLGQLDVHYTGATLAAVADAHEARCVRAHERIGGTAVDRAPADPAAHIDLVAVGHDTGRRR